MCVSVLDFFMRYVDCGEFAGRRVLEVGSKFVNGSVRPLIERFCKPREYVGADIETGKYVDVVLPAERLVEYFGPESFNAVISTESLNTSLTGEVNNMKAVLKPGGLIYITTRSRGFPYHAYPHDYWRYEIEDMEKIFGDFEIIALEKDYEVPGVFLKARKPTSWSPNDLSQIELYSMVLGRRTREIVGMDKAPLARRLGIQLCQSKTIRRIVPVRVIWTLIGKRYCI
ncbi:MAG: methyltransferase type 11 [Pyrobaculum sp.]|jgi:SAM-dependent methyltransferase